MNLEEMNERIAAQREARKNSNISTSNKKPSEVEEEDDEGFVDSVQNFFKEDVPDFLRMSADAQLQANKAQVEAAGLAAPIVAKAALETAKTPVNIAAMIGDITAPRTMDEIRQSEVGKFYADVIEKATPKFKEEVKEESELASDILSYMGGWKVGQKIFSELGEVLINKFGKTKGQKIAIEMERQIAKGGKTKADKVVKNIGRGGGLFGSSVVGGELMSQKDTDTATMIADNSEAVKEALQNFSLKDVLEFASPEIVQNQIADFLLDPSQQKDIANALKLINAGYAGEVITDIAEKLKRDPNDTESQAALKRFNQEVGINLTGGLIFAIPYVSYFATRFGIKSLKDLKNKSSDIVTKNPEELGRIGVRTAKLPSPVEAPIGSPIRNKVGAVLKDNKVTQTIGRVNTALGEILSSQGAVPKQLLNDAIERRESADAVKILIKKDLKDLRKLQNKLNISDDAFENAFNTGSRNLPEEFLTKVDEITNKINLNERLLSKALGLKGDAKLNVRAADQDFYITRTFLASNPEYVDKIRKGLKGKLKDKDLKDNPYSLNAMQFINNARDMLRKKGVEEDLINTQIDLIVSRVAPTKDNINLLERLFGTGKTNVNNLQDHNAQVLRKRKDLDDSVLDLLGQVKNPYKNLENTLFAQNKLLSEIKYLQRVEKVAKENLGKDIQLDGLFPFLPSQKARITQKPKGIAGEVDASQVKLSEIAKESIGRFGGDNNKILQNLASSPEFKRIVGRGVDLYNPNTDGSVFRNMSRFASLVQAKETLLDPMAYLLNTNGALQALVLNGHGFNPKNYTQALREINTLAQRVTLNDAKAVEKIAMLKRLGVIDQDLIGEQLAQNSKIVGKEIAGKAKTKYAKGMEKLGAAYGTPDTYAKIIAFESEKRSAKLVYPRNKFKGTDSEYEEFLNKEAARIVRDTNPTYGSAPRAFRALAQTPFIGNYVLFPSELARTYKNVLKETARDLTQGIVNQNPQQFARGARRGAGVLTMGVGLSAGYDQLDDYFNYNDNTHKILQATAAPYEKGARHIPLDELVLDETAGKLITRDQIKEQFPEENWKDIKERTGYTGSYNKFITERFKYQKRNYQPFIKGRMITSSSFEFTDQLNSVGRLFWAKAFGDNMMTSAEIDDAVSNALAVATNSYISPKALADRVLSAITGVDMKTGRSLYDEAAGATATDKLLKAGEIIFLEAGRGGLYKLWKDYVETNNAEELLGEGRAVNKYGNPYNKDDLFAWVATGSRPRTVNMNQRIGYSIYRDLDSINKLKTNFKNILKDVDVGITTSEDIDKLVQEHVALQERKREAMRDLHEKVGEFSKLEFTRIYGNPKNPKRERDTLDRNGVMAAATKNFQYNIDSNLGQIISQLEKEKDKVRFIPDDFNIDQAREILKGKGYNMPLLIELNKKIQKENSRFRREGLYPEEETEQ